jgi:Flp pilus assembly protein TadG
MLQRLSDRRLRRSRRADSTRSARTGEHGAVLIEAALIAPILFALVFGAMELGYAYFGQLTVKHMSVAGARSASGSAADVLADYNTLHAVKDASTGMATSDVTMVVIYRASAPSDRVPANCKIASVTNTTTTRGCNRYVGSDLTLASTQFGCVGPPGPVVKIDSYWCPTTRKTALLADNGNGPPDYIGVYVVAVHHNLFGVFGKSFTFSSDTVIRIEPRTLR